MEKVGSGWHEQLAASTLRESTLGDAKDGNQVLNSDCLLLAGSGMWVRPMGSSAGVVTMVTKRVHPHHPSTTTLPT